MLPLECFHRDTQNSDDHKGQCKSCESARQAAEYEANKAARLERQRERDATNHEANSKRKRLRRKESGDEERQRERESTLVRYYENRERELERKRQYYREHGSPDPRPFLFSTDHIEQDVWNRCNNGLCAFCGTQQDRHMRGPWGLDECWQIEHHIARHRGGSNVLSQLLIACSTCHRAKHRNPQHVLPIVIELQPVRELPVRANPDVEPMPLAADLHLPSDLVEVPA